MNNPPVALLFDLDGTLIHSSEDLADAANRMLEQLGLPLVDLPSVESWIGHGVMRLVNRCITREQDGEADPERDASPTACVSTRNAPDCYELHCNISCDVYSNHL